MANRTTEIPIAEPTDALPKPAPILTGSQRKQLRGLAHDLEPIVHVGNDGITDAVIAVVKKGRTSEYGHYV